MFVWAGLFFLLMGSASLLCAVKLFLRGSVFVLDSLLLSCRGVGVFATFALDAYRALFSAVVFLISSGVFIFAHGYMSGDFMKDRFGGLFFFFVVSMMCLIYSPNLVSILLGWDGLGLISFLLVIYYQTSYSMGAGLITALTNRVGDVFLLLLIALMAGR